MELDEMEGRYSLISSLLPIGCHTQTGAVHRLVTSANNLDVRFLPIDWFGL